MDLKDIILIVIASLGWIWGVVQFRLTRKYQKQDKVLEKRFEVYSTFMSKMDVMGQTVRTDPNMMYGIQNKFLAKALSYDETIINDALIEFNGELMEFTKKSLQPTLIINQELNQLKLICSDKLLPKINRYKELMGGFTAEYQNVLNKLSNNNDLNKTAEELKNFADNNTTDSFTKLWEEIEVLMREEIGCYNKK
jgi:vacuolar-type H+-ATPase subunit E/Vma4